jgi:hypothetical protein
MAPPAARGKIRFRFGSSARQIGVAGRQCPNAMEMVRQDADGVCFEWPARLIKKLARPISEHDREKEYPAFDFWAPISRHRRIIA